MSQFQGTSFGTYFKEMRLEARISQWEFCRKIDYHIRNVQKIEAGQQEPQLDSALQMVSALGLSYDAFFVELAVRAGLQRKHGGSTPSISLKIEQSNPPHALAQVFGAYLKMVREHFSLTQSAVAEKASYCLRSVTKLENGLQTPRIMSALKLVCATGCDVGWFFGELQRLNLGK